MVNRYIEHDLSVDELEDFLEHVENCPSCYDELETYFIVHAAMQQLDEESRDSTLDLRELLEEDIRRSKHYILKMRFRRALSGMGFCALIAGLDVYKRQISVCPHSLHMQCVIRICRFCLCLSFR